MPPRGQSWHTFLRNHTVWACDFLQTYDVWFQPIFAFFIVDINTKQVVHVGVTPHPTEPAHPASNSKTSANHRGIAVSGGSRRFGQEKMALLGPSCEGAPRAVNRLLEDPAVQSAFDRGLRFLGESRRCG
jgi:hypothetical protein